MGSGWSGQFEEPAVEEDALCDREVGEMQAAVCALEALKQPCEVTLFSDSSYLVNAFQKGWVERWRGNGWRKADGGAVKNSDLWERLVSLAGKHRVKFRHVAGHAGHTLNERCDKLARDAAASVNQKTGSANTSATERARLRATLTPRPKDDVSLNRAGTHTTKPP